MNLHGNSNGCKSTPQKDIHHHLSTPQRPASSTPPSPQITFSTAHIPYSVDPALDLPYTACAKITSRHADSLYTSSSRLNLISSTPQPPQPMEARDPLLHPSASYGATSQKGSLEAAVIARSLAPLIVTFLLQFLLETTTIFVSGRLGSNELAVASLALCSFNITAVAFYQGMSTSLDSFCSQAFGAGRPHMVGVYFQRCSVMMLAVTVFPLLPLWWFSGLILNRLVPSEDLALQCQTFLRIMIVGAPGLLFFETAKRFFQAQHIFNAGTYALAVSVPLHGVLNWFLVLSPATGLGLVGLPIALSISFWINPLVLLLYAVFVDGTGCWGGIDWRKATVNWKPMLRLAVPGVVMVEAEYLAFEVMTILAASFGTTALAAQSIGSNVGGIAFQVPFAVSVAVTTQVGHFIGLQDIKTAQSVTRTSICVGVGMGVLNFVVLFFGRTPISSLYSDDSKVVHTASKVLALAAFNQIADCTNIIAAGVLRGQGRQKIGSYLNLASYYLIALPSAYIFAFKLDTDVYGLWFGLICGVTVLALGEVLCVVRSQWERIVDECSRNHDA